MNGYREFINGMLRELTDAEASALEAELAPTAAQRIAELKELLEASDYKTLKYFEGELDEEEYAASCALRSAWRREINELEALTAASA